MGLARHGSGRQRACAGLLVGLGLAACDSLVPIAALDTNDTPPQPTGPICRTGPPTYVDTFDYTFMAHTSQGGIAARGDWIYVTVWDVAHMIKISALDNKLAWSPPLDLQESEGGLWGVDVAIDGNTWYVAEARSGFIRKYNTLGSLIGSGAAGPQPTDVVLHDATLYVVGQDDSLVRLLDEVTLAETNSFELPFAGGEEKDLFIEGDRIYFASTAFLQGFVVMNLDGSDPEPVPVSSLGYGPHGIAVQAGTVYMTTGNTVVVTDEAGIEQCVWAIETPDGSVCTYSDIALSHGRIYLQSSCGNDIAAHVVVYQ